MLTFAQAYPYLEPLWFCCISFRNNPENVMLIRWLVIHPCSESLGAPDAS